MKQISLLSQFGGKTNGMAFPATEWNAFVEDVTKACQMGVAMFGTGVIEQLTGNFGEETWNPYVQTQLAAGGVYRLSGYFDAPVVIAGTTEGPTKLILNNCCIETSSGSCINYISESKELKVVVEAGSTNFLIQKSTSADYTKTGAINSENNLSVTGTGMLYIENAVGHGVRGSKLSMRGNTTVIINAAHDACHGAQILDIYNGNYYVIGGNDAFGAGIRDTGEEGKLRGIVRVFGGKFHIYKINGDVFDAKYETMTAVNNGGTITYYSNEEQVGPGTVEQVYHSGFHTYKYILDGPAVTPSNISNNFADNSITAAGVLTINGIAKSPTSAVTVGDVTYSIYELTSADFAGLDAPEAIVSGYLRGMISTDNPSTEINLNHAIIEAIPTGTDAGIAIKYTGSKKNIQIQAKSGSEGNFIFGTIHSENNIKISPKSDAVINIEAAGVLGSESVSNGVGVYGSSVYFCNGAGSTYIYGCKVGSMGTEQWFGNDELRGNKNYDIGHASTGDVYVEDNDLDIYARLNSSGTKKGVFYVSGDFGGNTFAETIKTKLSYHLDQGENSGMFVGESYGSGKVFYNKNLGCATVQYDTAHQYERIDGAQLVNKF